VTDRPLFVPLKREWFEAFARGDKTDEWRRHGPRWNQGTCWAGREVILSLGYSTPHRLSARIASVALRYPSDGPGVELFGAGTQCIVLSLVDIKPA
jgi:hypothetical protein